MKKLLLLALLFAMPQAFAFFTSGKTAEQIEHQQKEAETVDFQKLVSTLEQTFPGLQSVVDKIKSTDLGGKLLTIISTIQDLTKSSFQNVEPAIEKISTLSKEITIADLRDLINQLNGYANNRLTGIRLNPVLAEIFNKVKDTYKKLVESDNELYTIQKGGILSTVVRKPETKLADAFLSALIFNIVQGKSSDELLPLITHSLELKSEALKVQPAK